MISSLLITLVVFYVTDISANTNPTISFTIDEELYSGYPVGSIANASRQYLNTNNTNLLYNFLPPTEYQTLFSINDKTGDIFTSVVIDRETVCEYDSVCILEFDTAVRSEDGPFFQIVSVNIYIEDKNDNSPLFPKESMNLEISEGANPGQLFRIDSAVDKDKGDNNSIQSYELIDDSETNGTFSLDVTKTLAGSFKLMLRVEKILDREVKDIYNLKVIARDGGEQSNSGVLEIIVIVKDINEFAPEFVNKSEYNVTVDESTPANTTIITLSATDKDNGENARILYRISDFQKDKNILDQIFSVNEETGDLKVKRDLTAYASETYSFYVEASDHGDEPLTKQAEVIVYIKDSGNNPPIVTVSSLYPGNIAFVNMSENVSPGTFVAHVNVLDTDKGLNGEVTCDISNQHFGLEDLEGKGFRVFVKAILDREVTNLHNVTVSCQDKGSPVLSNFTSFLVRVTDKNDNKPVFVDTNYSGKVPENKVGVTVIAQVSATDDDEGNNAIVHYVPHSDALDRFVVDRNTGVVSAVASFDRETEPIVTLRVLAIDQGSNPLTGTATVTLTIADVNDNVPTFTQSVHGFKVKENQPTGTDVATLSATDLDSGVNAEFDFAISPEYVDKVPFILFSDGLLKANQQLDREERSRYDFVAIVTDHGPLRQSSSAHVTVIVDDVNDNAPIVTFPKPSNNTVAVAYPDFENTYVTTIEAYDIDDGVNKHLQFFIKGGNDLNIFEINMVTGDIDFDRKIDIGKDMVIELEISVKDKGETVELETVKKLFVELQYTNATFLESSVSDDKSKYIIISVVVVILTLVISGSIIAVIIYLRTKDNNRKSKEPQNGSKSTDASDFGFPITQSHMIISADTLSSGSSTGRDLIKKKEVSFILDTSDNMDYHQQQNTSIASLMQEKPSKSSLRYTPTPDLTQNGLDPLELQNEANHQLQSVKVEPYMQQSRAKQWVQSQQYQYGIVLEDHHSDHSGETIGSDSGRGCSEEDDLFSTPSADDPRAFEISSPESQRSQEFMPPPPSDMYRDTQIQRTSSYIKQPWTRKPHLTQKNIRTSQPTLNINRNLQNRNMNLNPHNNRLHLDTYSTAPYNNASQNRLSFGSAYYGSVTPLDYTGDSALHSFFDKTPAVYLREDEDNCSTTTSGSYTLYSEEIL